MVIIRDKKTEPEVVIDHYSGEVIDRPCFDSKFQYDFDFRRSPQHLWRYVNSSNDLVVFVHQCDRVEKCKGQYRIVVAKTGFVVKTNKTW